MSQTDSGNSRNKIDVSVTFVVVEILIISFSDEKRLFVIMEIKVGHEFGAVVYNLFESWSSVGLGFMINLREFEMMGETCSQLCGES